MGPALAHLSSSAWIYFIISYDATQAEVPSCTNGDHRVEVGPILATGDTSTLGHCYDMDNYIFYKGKIYTGLDMAQPHWFSIPLILAQPYSNGPHRYKTVIPTSAIDLSQKTFQHRITKLLAHLQTSTSFYNIRLVESRAAFAVNRNWITPYIIDRISWKYAPTRSTDLVEQLVHAQRYCFTQPVNW